MESGDKKENAYQEHAGCRSRSHYPAHLPPKRETAFPDHFGRQGHWQEVFRDVSPSETANNLKNKTTDENIRN